MCQINDDSVLVIFVYLTSNFNNWTMKLNNIRLLVADFDACFEFYSEKLGLKVTWGEKGSAYASFDIGLPSGLALFKSELMAESVGNANLELPQNHREKTAIVLQVDSVDESYKELCERGVEFVNKPLDMSGWGDRVAHFRDPEGNLIEIFSELAKDKWDEDLREDAEKYKE
jgi:catechol 2,3-dioxygenase-like lactoylglutathione lyase family enzyme